LSQAREILRRVFRFNTVGLMGIVVQLVALAALKSGLGIHYLWATAIAVEIAVLHNFAWHQAWTWADRSHTRGWPEILSRLLRFNLTTGALSIFSNVVLMRVFAGALRIPYLPANLLAIAVTAVANYLVADTFVFHPQRSPNAGSTPEARRAGK